MPDNDTESRNADDLLDLAYPYALDAVSETERREIVGRLGSADSATVHAFRRIVADTHETMSRVGYRDTLAPPRRLRVNVLAAVDDGDSKDTGDELAGRRAQRSRFTLPRVLLAAAAAVLIVFGIAVATGQFTDHTPSAPSVAQVMSSPDRRTVVADVAGGTITVAASAQSNALVVSMTNIPPPPPGHVYQMWFMQPDREPRLAGTMGATTMPPPGGEVIPKLDTATSVTVTVEPGAGSSRPTWQPVITVGLT